MMEATRSHLPPSSIQDWRRHLAATGSEEEVVGLTREYVATLAPDHFSQLPAGCQPGRIRDGDDIGVWAYELAKAHCSLRYDDAQDVLLVRILGYIGEAAMRVAELKALMAVPRE
jgi:hypothetical protein